MSVKPNTSVTIDNLGLDASKRYAEDQKLYDPRLVGESKLISRKSEIPTVKPYVPSDVEQLFTISKGASWALFSPPPNFFVYGEALFSYQLIPSLGSQEQQEADAAKLEQVEDYLTKQKRKRRRPSAEELEKEEKERKALIAMFRCLHTLDKALILINARRNQYQRG